VRDTEFVFFFTEGHQIFFKINPALKGLSLACLIYSFLIS